MAFNLGEENQEGLNEINLIPLIDIMLVLMIIFLVTATLINPGIAVNLPKTDARVLPQDTVSPMVISIKANGEIFIENQLVTLNQLDGRLAEAAQQAKPPALHLQADQDARYDTVAQVMARASKAGLSDLAFINRSNTP